MLTVSRIGQVEDDEVQELRIYMMTTLPQQKRMKQLGGALDSVRTPRPPGAVDIPQGLWGGQGERFSTAADAGHTAGPALSLPLLLSSAP